MEVIVPKPIVGSDGRIIPWPTLGPQVCDFIERRFVYGPGTLKGEPYVVRSDFRYLIYRMYEHYPEGYIESYGSESRDLSGRRHFNKVIVSLPKGSAKTELMAIVSLVELHPDAPVRFNGYDAKAPGGMAPGRSVLSPFIPLLAPTLEQLKDLAYGAAMEIVKDIEDAALFDVNKERIMINGEGESKIIPVAASAGRLDGQKPTFQGIDEAHRMLEDRHIAAVTTIENNLKKRYADDPWQLSTTTAGDPSEPSMALKEYQYGMKIYEGKVSDPTTFFYHRGTSDENAKFDTMENRIKALKEASGPEASKFRDLFSVAKEWDDDNADHAYLERVWCNRWVQSSTSAFNAKKFRELGDPDLIIEPGSTIVLGFDGAISDDSTALVATEVESGIQNLVGIWEKPDGVKQWQVPVGEVHAAVEDMFENYDVLKLYADPPYWQEAISKWSGRWEKRVVEWPTRHENHIYYALRSYAEAINLGEVGHNGDRRLVAHIAASGKNLLNRYDDEGKQKFRLAKRSKDKKIDAAMAAVLSWQARLDALSEGVEEVEELTAPRRIR